MHLSIANHPQTDGQTEVVNKCLETYLMCFYSDSPGDWKSYLAMAEWWYNSSYHSSIECSPYEALYGRPPSLHLPYLSGESAHDEVDSWLLQREIKLKVLQFHLTRAQHRMKQMKDKYRSKRAFDVGDWVYLKLQPYRQISISQQPFNKLASKYYGPFQIIKKVGQVAYTLLFPDSVKIHLTFHVSLVKKCYQFPTRISLPSILDITSPLCPKPEVILQRRMIKKGNKVVAQILVK